MGKILSRLGEDLTPDGEVEGPGLRSGNGSWAGEGQKEQKGARELEEKRREGS